MGLYAISPFVTYKTSIGSIRFLALYRYTWCIFYWRPIHTIGGFTWRLAQNQTIILSTGSLRATNTNAQTALNTRNTSNVQCESINNHAWYASPVNSYTIGIVWFPRNGSYRWEIQTSVGGVLYVLATGGTNVYMPRGTYTPTQVNGNWVDGAITVS